VGSMENLNQGFFGAKWAVVACGYGIQNESCVFAGIL